MVGIVVKEDFVAKLRCLNFQTLILVDLRSLVVGVVGEHRIRFTHFPTCFEELRPHFALATAAFLHSVHELIIERYGMMETNGPATTYKTALDSYVESSGVSYAGNARFSGSASFFGNVGIGTENPAEKLSVNGKIRAKEVKVEVANWPDYVFSKDYRMMSLSAIEQFIKSNGHLPEMPNAAELGENGVYLGEMVKFQQKKIEELTLHLIDKEAELKKEKEENKRQNQRLLAIEASIKQIKSRKQ